MGSKGFTFAKGETFLKAKMKLISKKALKISGVNSFTMVEEERIKFTALVGWVGFPGEDFIVFNDFKVVKKS